MTELIMAEPSGSRPGIRQMRKTRLKIDMTPMVDLGFLLISFFIFTTEMSRPTTTKLNMPYNGDSTRIADLKSMTILLTTDDKVYYYCGNFETALATNEIM